MSQILTTSNHDVARALTRALDQYQPAAKQTAVLELYKDAVLGFRAKGASCAELERILCEHGLRVHEHTLLRFCRKHEAEILRLRQKMKAPTAQMASLVIGDQPTDPPLLAHRLQPTPSPAPKTRSMRGPA